MKYEEITLLRKLVSDEVFRNQTPASELKSYSEAQQQEIRDNLEIALSLKREIDNLEFKIK